MFGLSLTYNGTYLGGEDYGVIVLRAARLGMADVRLGMQEYGSIDGAASHGATLAPKYWTDVIEIVGTSQADLQTKIDNVMFVLDSRLGEKLLKYDRETSLGVTDALDRQYYARLNGPLIANYIGTTTAKFNLNWTVPSGHAIGLAQVTETLTVASSPDTLYIPVAASDVVGGNNVAEPVFVFQNDTGGDVTAVTLVNVTLGTTTRWTGVLANTHYLRIDGTQRQTIERSTDGITYTSAISGLTAGDPFPQLSPKVRSEFTLTGFSSAANATAVYWEQFI